MHRTACVALAASLLLVAGCGGTRWSDRAGATPTAPVATGPTTPAADWVAFRDPSGVAFSHPAAWTAQPGSLGPLYVYIDRTADSAGFRRNVNVLVQTIPAGFSPADYLRVSLSQMTSAGATLEAQAPATLGGLAGHQVTWRITKSGLSVRFLSVWAVRGTHAFLVTYSADTLNYDAALADVQRMISTITLPPA